jgi:ribosome biogenesis GTPase / thiamine phosphate phosphatase
MPSVDPTAAERLARLGWNETVATNWDTPRHDGLEPARVVRTDRGAATVWRTVGVDERATATTAARDTVAGDWVGLAIVRRAARGAKRPQTLAANMDLVVVVQALDPGVNERRLERELVLAHQSGARPFVVITKADLLPDPSAEMALARAAARGVDIALVSNRTGEGIEALRALMPAGTTVAFLGASGVGKSSIVNSIAGERVQLEGEVRAGDAKGRHTTSAAQLLAVGELLIIDTPGVRALAVWEIEEGLDLAFPEIAAAAERCRFDDCTHRDEPRCAVVAAVEAGEIDPARLAHWHQLIEEAIDVIDEVEAEADGEG